ncbi:ubiquitin thioesterase otubain-like family protein [Toxoplasma gondii]|uniref:ubiquitinyl hydrolase 1 n=1 Tax=Toxoplasma gondii TaxID=5811 RepID=A0A7J6K192_TOXGO|nr:ubiquitin thioesterase otubain-like family protein [Toxoplasma gondii]
MTAHISAVSFTFFWSLKDERPAKKPGRKPGGSSGKLTLIHTKTVSSDFVAHQKNLQHKRGQQRPYSLRVRPVGFSVWNIFGRGSPELRCVLASSYGHELYAAKYLEISRGGLLLRHWRPSAEIESQPLVGKVESLDCLFRDFEGNPALCAKARTFVKEQQQRRDACCSPSPTEDRAQGAEENDREAGHSHEDALHGAEGTWNMRRVRKDGCCFYRAYMYGVFLCFLRQREKIKSFIKRINDELLPKVQEVNAGAETVADFAEETVENLEKLESPEANTQTLDDIFNDTCSSNYIVVFARLLASTHIKLNSELYLPFLTAYATVEDYCSHEVDPMWVEAEQPQIMALTAMTQMPVEIVYFDQSPGEVPVRHIFPHSDDAQIHLIYRPGHYDFFFYSPRQAGAHQST